MKLFLLFFLFIFYNLFGQNYLKISDKIYDVDAPISIVVNLFNADTAVGYQFDVKHSPLFEYSGKFELSNRYSDHSAAVNVVNDSTLRILCFSLNNQPINNSDSVIITLFFNSMSTAGNYPFELENAIVSNSTAQNILDSVKTGLITINDPTSVKTQKSGSIEGNIKVYPNPFNSQINVIFKSGKNGKVRLSLFDITGEMVFSRELHKNGKDLKYIMDLNGLSTGVYFLSLTTRNKQFGKKVLYLK